jgi:hypothetical protein
MLCLGYNFKMNYYFCTYTFRENLWNELYYM